MTGDADDALRLDSGTGHEDIRRFVERRATDPLYVGDGDRTVTVWNFSNHTVDETALDDALPRLERSRYVIAFDKAGVWATMRNILPVYLQRAEYLVYRTDADEYWGVRNFDRWDDSTENRRKRVLERAASRSRIRTWLVEEMEVEMPRCLSGGERR